MIISDLFNTLKIINSHQYPDDVLLMWLTDIEKDINEYLTNTYLTADVGNTEDLTTKDETTLDEPSLYIEWLSHKIDLANGEYERANNHAAMFNALYTEWKERYFRTNASDLKRVPAYIRGL